MQISFFFLRQKTNRSKDDGFKRMSVVQFYCDNYKNKFLKMCTINDNGFFRYHSDEQFMKHINSTISWSRHDLFSMYYHCFKPLLIFIFWVMMGLIPWQWTLIIHGSEHQFKSWEFLLLTVFPILLIIFDLIYMIIIGLIEIPRYKMSYSVKQLSINLKEYKRNSKNSIEDDIYDLYVILNERLMIIMVINKYVNQDIANIIIDDLNQVYLLDMRLKSVCNL